MTVERGPLFLVAGSALPVTARGPDPLVRLAIQSTGMHRPSVAYVGAASRDDSLIRKHHAAMLRKAGAGVITTAPLAGYRINAPVAAAAVESADLVFLSGGDVEAGMDVLVRRGMIPVLRRAHRAGTPFLGISAGSIMLSRAWIRWTDPEDDEGAETFPCLGLARICCDTHGEDDGWGELKAMLSLRPVGTKGFGIVSGSAIVVAADGTLSALGGEVHVFKRLKAGVVQVESLVPGPRPGTWRDGIPTG
jgi:peptidase E